MRIIQFLKNKATTFLKDYSNLPESYIQRSKEQIYWKTPRGLPNYLPRTVQRKKFRYTMNRSWTAQFLQQNMMGSMRKKVFVEPIEEWNVFRGDRVEVLVGRDKGKQGFVKQVIAERNWAVVEGLNCHYRKVGKDKEYPGIIIKSEAPLLITSQIALVDPSDLQATEMEWRFTEEGEKVRVSLRTGRIIPIPKTNEETYDYKTQSTYVERPKDTSGTIVKEVTFKPSLRTFEMEIMDEMGIKEERVPKKSYWY